jgi:GLPGLI family protein
MIKKKCLFIWLLFVVFKMNAQAVYNDGLVSYDVTIAGSDNPTYLAYFKDASMKLYLRGMKARSELKTALGSTTTIHDKQTGNAVILNEYGDQKIMVKMNAAQYKQVNKKYENPEVEYLNETKIINGYKCSLVKVKFSGGNTFSVFYAPELNFQNNYFGLPVELKGFPLEYEAEIGGVKVLYKANTISTGAVQAALFDLPTSGYREMKFEEMPKN